MVKQELKQEPIKFTNRPHTQQIKKRKRVRPVPLEWKTAVREEAPAEYADETVARCFYPGVIKQGDKSTGPIAIARARL
jgi:hypothetical protein